MRPMKKIMAAAVAGCVLLNSMTVWGGESPKKPMEVSFLTAIGKAREYDQTDKVKEIQIYLAQKAADEEKEKVKNPENDTKYYNQLSQLMPGMQLIWKQIVPDEKQYEVEKLKVEKEEYDQQIRIEAEYLFNKAMLLDAKLKLQKEALEIALKDFATVQLRAKTGTMSVVDVKKAELEKIKAEMDVVQVEDERNDAYQDLKDYMGIGEADITLLGREIKEANLPTYTKDQVMVKVENNNITYLHTVKQKEFKQRRFDIYVKNNYFGDGRLDAERDLLLQEIENKKISKQEKIGAYTEYIKLHTTKIDLDTVRKSLELQNMKVSIKETQLKTNTITELELIKEKLAYKKMSLELKQQINEYNRQIAIFLTKI